MSKEESYNEQYINFMPTSTILLQKTRKEPSCRRFAAPSRAGQAWSVPSAASPGPLPAGDVEKGQEIAALSVSFFKKLLMVTLNKIFVKLLWLLARYMKPNRGTLIQYFQNSATFIVISSHSFMAITFERCLYCMLRVFTILSASSLLQIKLK